MLLGEHVWGFSGANVVVLCSRRTLGVHTYVSTFGINIRGDPWSCME